jgi:hypothetical protein
MTVLFALIPSLVAVAIFVGTFRLTPPGSVAASRAQRTLATVKVSSSIRTPLPLGSSHSGTGVQQLRA